MIDQVLKRLKGNISRSYYEELEYCAKAFGKGKITKEAYVATIQDVIYEIKQRQAVPPAKFRKTKAGGAYYLNEAGDTDGPAFTLLSEPTEDGFFSSYHDIEHAIEDFRPDDPLEQKGRIIRPLSLENYLEFLLEEKRKTLGVDVARFGDDKSVLVVLYGGHVIDIQAYYKQDTTETTGRVIDAINEHKPDEVMIDGTGGWGSAIYDNLISLEFEELATISMVAFNAEPREERFNAANARAEMFLMLQEQFRKGFITLPMHKPLIEELTWIKYKYTLSGKIILESKEACKAKNKRSPDHADALALACYARGNLTIY
jgi:hypothetical protein